MQEAMLAQLKAVPLFQAVASRELSALAERTHRRRLGAGALVFQEGSPADSSLIAADLPAVRRWALAKRWVLASRLILAVAQFYFMDVFLQIVSMPSLTLFPPR